MVGFGEEFEWRGRGWPTTRAVTEREGTTGRKSAEMSEKKERGKKKETNRYGRRNNCDALSLTQGPAIAKSWKLSHTASGRWSTIV